MTPQQLKNSILQLAIQGKLVEQIPSEGTAEELYEQIQEEKKRLIAEKKIKKSKILEPIKEEDIPFDIPESWMWIKLNDCGYWAAGATPSRTIPEYYGGNIPWLKTGDLNDGIVSEIPEKITEKALNETSVKLNPIGTVLMAMYGATIGKLGILEIPATTNQACCACDVYKGIYNKYLFYYLLAQRREFIRQGEGGAQPNISKEKIINFVFALPPYEEQKRIVDRIEEIMPLVERYGDAWTKLETFNRKFPEDMKKSILQQAIQGKLVEQRAEEGTADTVLKNIANERKKLILEGVCKKEKKYPVISESEKIFDIPENWEWVRLASIVYNKGQKTPVNNFSYIDIGSIDNMHQKLSDTDNIIEADKAPSRARKIVSEGDILYSTVRPYLHNMCIIDRQFSEEPIASTGFAVMSCFDGIYNKYLFYYLLSPCFDQYANSTDNAKGVAYPAINDDRLYKAVVALPPLDEQKRIVNKIEELLPLCDSLIK